MKRLAAVRRSKHGWWWAVVAILGLGTLCWMNIAATSSRLAKAAVPLANIDGLTYLVQRRVPIQDQGKFTFRLVAAAVEGGQEFFEWRLLPGSGLVEIESNTLNGLAMGLGEFYRRKECGLELVLWADPTRPATSAECFTTVRSSGKQAKFPIRYGWNAVTFSYSTSWWSWDRYELELDWLALRGVNLLLAHEGQEYVLQQVFAGVCQAYPTDEQFFTHEAYFAWNRMGNIRAVGGTPNPKYIANRYQLQLQILQRMQELGIAPVLPAFNGFAPCFGRKKYKLWSGFSPEQSSVPRLEPESAEFKLIAARMVEFQLKAYSRYLSSTVYFSLDPFNENSAEGMEDTFPLLAKALVQPATNAASTLGFTPQFVMQMWFLGNDWEFWTKHRAKLFLEAFPSQSLLLLDLHADKQSQVVRLGLHNAKWFHQRVVFCVLHNFGGGGGVAGEIPSMLLASESFAGIGFAPEGIEQNELVYDYVLNSAWGTGAFSIEAWVAARYRRRMVPATVLSAWQRVYGTAYSRPKTSSGWGNTKSLMEVRPMPFQALHSLFMPTLIDYPVDTFVRATSDLLSAALSSSPAFVYDVIAFARQALADWLIVGLDGLEHGEGEKWRREIAQALNLMGKLLSSDDRFCYQAQPKHYIMLLPTQQRFRKQLLTVWHEDNDGSLADYGSQQLGGALFHQVHRKRWDLLLRRVSGNDSLAMRNFGKLLGEFRAVEMAWVDGPDVDECDFGADSLRAAAAVADFIRQRLGV
ncbi:hypothetical protein BASA81_001855 [Batrachochytrium salamandrivorans]|nr:hypothetical protein BASA81_001855 [Batrachochytrium salamandrivorans]